ILRLNEATRTLLLKPIGAPAAVIVGNTVRKTSAVSLKVGPEPISFVRKARSTCRSKFGGAFAGITMPSFKASPWMRLHCRMPLLLSRAKLGGVVGARPGKRVCMVTQVGGSAVQPERGGSGGSKVRLF